MFQTTNQLQIPSFPENLNGLVQGQKITGTPILFDGENQGFRFRCHQDSRTRRQDTPGRRAAVAGPACGNHMGDMKNHQQQGFVTDLSYKQMNIYEFMCEMVNVMGIGRKRMQLTWVCSWGETAISAMVGVFGDGFSNLGHQKKTAANLVINQHTIAVQRRAHFSTIVTITRHRDMGPLYLPVSYGFL